MAPIIGTMMDWNLKAKQSKVKKVPLDDGAESSCSENSSGNGNTDAKNNNSLHLSRCALRVLRNYFAFVNLAYL